jgi:hypothetical protein
VLSISILQTKTAIFGLHFGRYFQSIHFDTQRSSGTNDVLAKQKMGFLLGHCGIGESTTSKVSLKRNSSYNMTKARSLANGLKATMIKAGTLGFILHPTISITTCAARHHSCSSSYRPSAWPTIGWNDTVPRIAYTCSPKGNVWVGDS